MDRFELQKLRDLPIEGVAERLGLHVVRHKCLCPFHDDEHPSLSFNLQRNTFRCFVCGASGGTIDLAMRVHHLGFVEACRWLGDAANIALSSDGLRGAKGSGISGNSSDSSDSSISGISGDSSNSSISSISSNSSISSISGGGSASAFDASRYERYFERPWLSPSAQQFLFGERRLDPRVVRYCRLTTWQDRRRGVEWIQIPYYDLEGALIGIQNRRLGPSPAITVPSPSGTPTQADGQEVPRFLFPTGSRCGIYNLQVLRRLKPGDELWITEGCSDCWTALTMGHKAIAIPSATLLRPADRQVFERLQPLALGYVMAADNDLPGERLFLQLSQMLPQLQRFALAPGCKDLSEMYVRG